MTDYKWMPSAELEDDERYVAIQCMTCLVNQSGCCSAPWPAIEAMGCPGAARLDQCPECRTPPGRPHNEECPHDRKNL